jgi:hypothetical protein
MSDNPIKNLAEHNEAILSFVNDMSEETPKTDNDNAFRYTRVSEETEQDTPEVVQPRSKMEIYEDDLAEFDLTLEDAAKIVDQLIFNQAYIEEVPITRKLTVKFRTRTPKQVHRMYKVLEDIQPNIQGMAVSIVSKYNLAFSLVEFDGKRLNPDTDDGLKRSLDLIDRLPGPLYNVLLNKLSKFDEKLSVVMREEAIVNF